MLWYVDDHRAKPLLEGTCALTWSWASFAGDIGQTVPFIQYLKVSVPPLEIIAVDVEYANENSFGHLNLAIVCLQDHC